MPAAYRWVILAVCALSFIQVHIHRLAFAPLIPTFVADLGISYAAAGAIQTAYFWTYTAVQVPLGVFTDRWGSRRVMALFMVLLGVGTLAFAGSQTYAQSVAARALVGLGAAAVWVPGMRLITEWFPIGERGRVTGLFSAGGGVGGTLALVLIPWLAEHWGWRMAYRATLLPLVVALTLVLLLVRSHEAPAPLPAVPASSGLVAVLATSPIWWFNLTVMFSYGGYFSMLTFLPAFFMERLGLSPPQSGFVTSLITAGTTVSWPLAGYVSDRLGRRKAVYLASQTASVLVCVMFALLGPGTSLGAAALATTVTGIVVGGMITPYVMVVERYPRELAGTVLGIINTAAFAGGMILPVILGRVVDVTGSFPAALVVAGAVQALALILGCFIRETGAR